jgi:DNA-binding PadR family transcriptional regulator
MAQAAAFIPLTPRTFHILLALVERPRNGYQIMGAVEENSRGRRGRASLGPGTLYESLHRLTGRGLIQEVTGAAGADPDGRGQRFYRLTPLGTRVVRAEAERLAGDVRLAQALRVLEVG